MKSRKGFVGVSREEHREISRAGGRAAQKTGRAHRFTTEEAREAGRKGGLAGAQRRREAEIAKGEKLPPFLPSKCDETALENVAPPGSPKVMRDVRRPKRAVETNTNVTKEGAET